MAEEEELALITEAPPAPPEPPPTFLQTQFGRNLAIGIGIAVVLAVMGAVWMWTQKQDDVVLFSNVSDRDGGAIIASLQALNIPYKYSAGGGAILVPANQVHDARLKLAAQGLPKGGNVGFELMENQKLGVSQFLEQVNFQRALEGELARTIGAVGAVESVRVHLALPKPSVFVRDQQKPTASVFLTLHPNRTMDPAQVRAIVHLVASSVPDLPPANVTVVDQDGNLLSDPNKANKGLDPNQLKYVQQLQQNIVKQVESLVAPIVGPNNVRAEATADVDFSLTEQAAESYRPNSPPEKSAIRSQQTLESQNGGNGQSGIPGSLTNQPPNPSAAPVTTTTTSTSSSAASSSTRKESTTNFEVDKTIRYSQQAMGGLKRLSVAVALNYKRIIDPKTGNVTIKPLTDAEKNQITDLVREAMGFNRDRGDTLNVSNIPFDGVDKPEPVPVPVPWWKDRDNFELLMKGGKLLLGIIVLAFLYFKFLRPLLRPVLHKFDEITKVPEPELTPAEVQAALELAEAEARGETAEGEEGAEEDENPLNLSEEELEEAKQDVSYRANLDMAKKLAKEDPRIIANVIKAWIGANE
jgi:flagellar M-ring protein FliF